MAYVESLAQSAAIEHALTAAVSAAIGEASADPLLSIAKFLQDPPLRGQTEPPNVDIAAYVQHFGPHIRRAIAKAVLEASKARSGQPLLFIAAHLLQQRATAKGASHATVVMVAPAIVEHMASPTGRKELKELFQNLDTNGDGKISKKEWGQAISDNQEMLQKYFGGSSLAEIGAKFKLLDVDGSGDLTWEEFEEAARGQDVAGAIIDLAEDEVALGELYDIFNALDTNHEGKVSRAAWVQAIGQNKLYKSKLCQYFGGATDSDIMAGFNRIDLDRSGYLDWEEFITYARAYRVAINLAEAMQSAEGQAEMYELFKACDLNGDGQISQDEWVTAINENKLFKVELCKYFGSSSEDEIRNAFSRIDADGNGFISWDEFVSASSYGLA